MNFARACVALMTALLLQACDNNNSSNAQPAPPVQPQLMAGAASRSILPTFNGGRDYLRDAPGWLAAGGVDPNDPGVFVASWDQGEVDVGNGRDDSAWVHDDLRTTALALELGEEKQSW
jgi:hypothetical protein